MIRQNTPSRSGIAKVHQTKKTRNDFLVDSSRFWPDAHDQRFAELIQNQNQATQYTGQAGKGKEKSGGCLFFFSHGFKAPSRPTPDWTSADICTESIILLPDTLAFNAVTGIGFGFQPGVADLFVAALTNPIGANLHIPQSH